MNHASIRAALAAALVMGLGLSALSLTPANMTLLPGPALDYSGPVVIRKGGTYRGNWQSLNPRIPVITIATREPVIIEDSYLRGRGDLIRGFHVNLTVRNTHGYGLNPQVDGAYPGRFLAVEFIANLRAENNYLQGTSGMYINRFEGNAALGQTIKILRNKVQDVDGRYVDRTGRTTGSRYNVQAVQLNRVVGVPNIEIAWNAMVNQPGKSAPEENINLYETSGTASSPIRIHNNYIHGAYAVDPLKDKAYSGGGIMLGDGSEKDLSVAGGHTEVYRNQIINTSNQGVAIAGGHDQHVWQNRILSTGRLPGGEIIPTANVGIYVWDILGGARQSPPTFFGNSVQDNLIGWTRFHGNGNAWYNNLWTPSCTSATRSVCRNNRASAVDATTERGELALWQGKLRAAKMVVGPRKPPLSLKN
ncbi:hypothetical protein [Deinococcus marmoris]|uniref:hypothetical protein n=1 Tax=Deinococcus marmoris TaxID=249408 RepID=UPI000495F6E0|nr:hypothetical protein [Deinococcus marmoris]